MAKKLKVPSLQHLARNWRENPRLIQNALVRLAKNPPTFNYNPLFSAAKDLLVLKVPYEQVVIGIRQGVKRESVRENLLEVLPLIRDHFSEISPDFFQLVDRRYYPVKRGLMIPFEPPLIYGVKGKLCFPWFSFWRQNPLANERLSLFVTLVQEVLLQDPDLEEARFEILDFSAPKAKTPQSRKLNVINARDIPHVSEIRKIEMLEIFADGYFSARDELSNPANATESDNIDAILPDPKQPDLFD